MLLQQPFTLLLFHCNFQRQQPLSSQLTSEYLYRYTCLLVYFLSSSFLMVMQPSRHYTQQPSFSLLASF
ncbi:hypothetical protein N665_0188s0006 [Sinapis alba]|nr:hypothetical protein N665_0188s0006 [Sinapis alba]